MKLYIYVIRRLLLLIPVILGVTVVTFFLAHANEALLISGYLGKIRTPAHIAAVKAMLHLNGPIFTQYFYYLGALFTGNWGILSPTEQADAYTPVVTEFMRRFPPTIELAAIAILLIVAMGIPLGVFSAVKKDRLTDQATRVVAMVGVSVPLFFVGLLVLMVMGPASILPSALRLQGAGQIPISYYYVPGTNTLQPWINPNVSGLTRPTDFLLIDTLIYGDWRAFLAGLWTVFWPALVVAFGTFGVIIRFMRGSMLEVMGQDFIRTARSKGVPEYFVIRKHVRRNALGATTTVMGLTFAGLLGGVVLTETVFGWPGMGRWAYYAAFGGDMASIIAITFVFTLIIVTANLIVDILYSVLDPRVRLE
ncbi:MAG: ABC transporter permease [Candidatus Thermoplasmatota archaeon]|nr:ABC transporter permease [Candidatus Thermoplasmatota archaeon]